MATYITLDHPRQNLVFDVERIITLREGVSAGLAFTVYFDDPREHKLVRWKNRDTAQAAWETLRLAIARTRHGPGFTALGPDSALIYNTARMVRVLQGRPTGPGGYISLKVAWAEGSPGDLCVVRSAAEIPAILATLNRSREILGLPPLDIAPTP